jgi:hypothetical protein
MQTANTSGAEPRTSRLAVDLNVEKDLVVWDQM